MAFYLIWAYNTGRLGDGGEEMKNAHNIAVLVGAVLTGIFLAAITILMVVILAH